LAVESLYTEADEVTLPNSLSVYAVAAKSVTSLASLNTTQPPEAGIEVLSIVTDVPATSAPPVRNTAVNVPLDDDRIDILIAIAVIVIAPGVNEGESNADALTPIDAASLSRNEVESIRFHASSRLISAIEQYAGIY
jgi:hypothetical protein